MLLRHWIGRAGRYVRPALQAAPALAFALALSACANSDPTVTGSIPAATGTTIAFESIDGPPRPVFDGLVAALTAEAERRELPVVSHTVPSAYRVRVYLATFIEKKKKRATLTWAWEVLDTRENRAFRLTGEEALGAPRGDVWTQADSALLSRIARNGFDELAGRVDGPPPAAPRAPETPAPAGPAIAFTDAQ